MKKVFAALLSICLALSLCGCDSWMDGSYYNIVPHPENDDSISQEAVEIRTYLELRTFLVNLVAEGGEHAIVVFKGFSLETVSSNMDTAIRYVTDSNAIGAYAVENINYEIGTNNGRTAAAVEVTYQHGRAEILRIKKANSIEEANRIVAEALENCDAGVVFQINAYRDTDFTQLVQDYMDTHPDKCMEMPQVSVAIYPERGQQRVVELSFTYQNSREDLRQMQSYVEPVFTASELNVQGEEDESAKFTRIYSFLMERADYQIETSITPSYSLLRHGVGDSKAFATVYAAMCTSAGLDCRIVTGTRAGVPWVWNIICENGVYYHVDLLQSSGKGMLYRFEPDDMQGYVWDYSAYPPSGTAAEDVAGTE